MTFQIVEGQIFLHKNHKAEGNQPPVRGSLMINGVQYDVALWGSRSGKDGSYSGKVSLPRTKASDFIPNNHVDIKKEDIAHEKENAPQRNNLDDEIPW